MELQIEEAWVALTKMPPKRKRTLFLTPGRRVVWYSRDLSSTRAVEIGTYTTTVSLVELREDVFFANEQMRDAAKGERWDTRSTHSP
ncbi:MAG TPA: hypothetical protein VIT90_15300 [Lysobacter sp.]